MGPDARWSPAAWLVVLAWFGTAAGATWFGLMLADGADPGGFLFTGVSATGLGLAALFGTRARPRLSADADGLTIGGLWRTRHHPWPLVRSVRLRQVRRLGRDTTLLEVDLVTVTGEEWLAVFGRLDLGADPHDVADRVLALRPPRAAQY